METGVIIVNKERFLTYIIPPPKKKREVGHELNRKTVLKLPNIVNERQHQILASQNEENNEGVSVVN
jgi:hypothetical protein